MAKNRYFYVDVDFSNETIVCVLDNGTKNSSCTIEAVYKLQQITCSNDVEMNDNRIMSEIASIAHLPRNEIICFVAKATNSSFTMILTGNFSIPSG